MRQHAAFVLVVVFAAFAASAAEPAPPAATPLPRAKPESVGMSSQRLARIAGVVNADIEKNRLPGAVIAVARKGKLVYYQAFGYIDKDAGTKMTTDAIFSIASMTKPMVAVAALDLYERGQLKLDEPVATYLPQLAKPQVAVLKVSEGGPGYETAAPARAPTVIDLMRHTSGWAYGGRGSTPVHKLYPAGSSAAALQMNGGEFIDKLATLPLLHQPGTRWEYGFGLDILGIVIERVSVQPLGQYLQERLWKPLGMKDTGFVVSAAETKRYAKAFAKDPDTGNSQFVLDVSKPVKFECGGGCAVSTAGDYLRFAQMLLNGGALDGRRILGRKTVEFMLSDQLPPGTVSTIAQTGDPTRADYGFGLGVEVRSLCCVLVMYGLVFYFFWL
jgi:CubicO group peptidase (beta-lactamase class C family)